MPKLKVVELPGLQAKEDIIDWVKIPGNTKENLVELVRNTTEWVPSKWEAASPQTPKECAKHNIKISTIDDMLQYEPPEYLIKPIIYKNTVNLLQLTRY